MIRAGVRAVVIFSKKTACPFDFGTELARLVRLENVNRAFRAAVLWYASVHINH